MITGKLRIMGQIDVVELDQPGGKFGYDRALLIEFDSDEAIRQALKDDGCRFTFGDQGVRPMSFSVQELRPEVLKFALLMEARLREKDLDKAQSWKNSEMQHLRVNMVAKAGMLEHSLGGVEHGRPLSVAVTKHAVDLANYTMMIADVAGALEDTDDNGGAGWPGLDQVQMS